MLKTEGCRRLTRVTVLRSEAAAGVVVGRLSAGEIVRVVERSGRWIRIENLLQQAIVGWTYRRHSEWWPCPGDRQTANV